MRKAIRKGIDEIKLFFKDPKLEEIENLEIHIQNLCDFLDKKQAKINELQSILDNQPEVKVTGEDVARWSLE